MIFFHTTMPSYRSSCRIQHSIQHIIKHPGSEFLVSVSTLRWWYSNIDDPATKKTIHAPGLSNTLSNGIALNIS